MQTEIRLGRCYGQAWTTRSSAFAGTAALWAILAIAAATLLKTTWAEAIALGLAAALLHWLSETWHQLGHAWAARRTGHPMTGVRFWGVLSTSVYPADEGQLPARVHVRRALGGPTASLLLTLVAGGIAFCAARDICGPPGAGALLLPGEPVRLHAPGRWCRWVSTTAPPSGTGCARRVDTLRTLHVESFRRSRDHRLQRPTRNVQRSTRNVHAPNRTWP